VPPRGCIDPGSTNGHAKTYGAGTDAGAGGGFAHASPSAPTAATSHAQAFADTAGNSNIRWMTTPDASRATAAQHRNGAGWAALALVGLGLAVRTAPLLDEQRLLYQYTSEDGYLMLTVARNLALGHGMSVSAGTVATNGVQPLATALWAGCFALVGGDRVAGVRCVQILSILIALLCTGAAYRFLAVGLRGRSRSPDEMAALLAALWFCVPTTVQNQHNALETGLSTWLVLVCLLHYLRIHRRTDARSWILHGLLLGIGCWARNDLVLLVAAIGIHQLLLGRLRAPLLAGAVSFAVLLPWMAYNLRAFGHVVPISGAAEMMYAKFGATFDSAVAWTFQYLLVFVPIPRATESSATPALGTFAAQLAGLAAILFAARSTWRRVQRMDPEQRRFWEVSGLHFLLLFGFYGFWFGAEHFVGRFLFPASPFLLAVSAGLWRGRAALAVLVLGVLTAGGLDLRDYRAGLNNGHRQVVDWAASNVGAEEWVGAFQSGTLGFFHDRTLNLDGKVDPEALAWRRRDRLAAYIASKPIVYVADWEPIASWRSQPVIERSFELIIDDPRNNLAVWKRRPGH
jgi:hypothetical protein